MNAIVSECIVLQKNETSGNETKRVLDVFDSECVFSENFIFILIAINE